MQNHVTKITIGRLFNIGRYEHVRYEIAVELGPDSNPAATLQQLESVLEDLNPKSEIDAYEIATAQASLTTPEAELDPFGMSHETAKIILNSVETAKAKRAAAYEALNKLGGSETQTATLPDVDQ